LRPHLGQNLTAAEEVFSDTPTRAFIPLELSFIVCMVLSIPPNIHQGDSNGVDLHHN
jgi:hypothetical protein